jgi:3-(3-hydroxy-phenyl)propionate hydroxylase
MPPFMAQGLCSGIRDAANLGGKITAVLRGGAPEALLDSYAQERKPHLRQLVETTKELGLLIGELDPAKAAARDARLSLEMESGSSETVRQKLVPNLTAGMIAMDAAGHPQAPAGLLSPQPLVRGDSDTPVLLDQLVGARFLLLTFGTGPLQWVEPETMAVWHRLGGVTLALSDAGTDPAADAVVETGTLIRDWMTEFGCRALLVRPDKYAYGGADNAASLNAHMLDIGRSML